MINMIRSSSIIVVQDTIRTSPLSTFYCLHSIHDIRHSVAHLAASDVFVDWSSSFPIYVSFLELPL